MPPAQLLTHYSDSLFWRLRYADGSYITEDPASEYQSIRWTRPGAIALQIVSRPDTPEGDGLTEVPLPSGSRPVFYRHRFVDARLSVAVDAAGRETGPAGVVFDAVRPGAVVYGWARGSGAVVEETRLWAWVRGRRGLNHPITERLLDTVKIEEQMRGY